MSQTDNDFYISNINEYEDVEEDESEELYTICLVTCYSEGEAGIRSTLDSIACTEYDDSKKLLFIIADGLIKGEGNDQLTSDIILSLISERYDQYKNPASRMPEPQLYLSIALENKQKNMARVHSGVYTSFNKEHQVPTIVVVKCGNPDEINDSKPGNRGKRDSQVILMNFLNRIIFNDRMTPLDYELAYQIQHTAGVFPVKYDLVLMIDADTKIKSDSLTYMVKAMVCDEKIMGLCGETRILNKTSNFVTAIQVFEYYISHHLSKAFESVFGGVTCLPGCFCMYRIKSRKNKSNYVVPILANPDIISEYSQNVIDSLHKKNLLLLGEDRFLSTLMLKTFPKRKMMFIPQARCKTIVPDTFKVLLSQRRRWINSTIHNLLKLVFVNDLCGTFCFSMQFVVFFELCGTVVLPAALSFTIYICLSFIFSHSVEILPMILLFAILGLPGVLIFITSMKWNYILWMIVYLFALPIWNFILPLYAVWHMDDFSWGETRKISSD
ncbi:glycosyltransferase family 2 protein, partial [Piromyces sp. E2]